MGSLYFKCDGKSRYNNIEVSCIYDLGRTDYMGRVISKRGYYLEVRPVSVENYDGHAMVAWDGAGKSYCLREVKRKSEKAAQAARKMAADLTTEKVKEVAALYGLTLERGEKGYIVGCASH